MDCKRGGKKVGPRWIEGAGEDGQGRKALLTIHQQEPHCRHSDKRAFNRYLLRDYLPLTDIVAVGICRGFIYKQK